MLRCWDWSAWSRGLVLGGRTPPLSRRPGHELPGSARPMWRVHPSVQAAKAAGECDEAAEMGPRPRGREGPPPLAGWIRRSFPETRPGSADGDWLTRFGRESQTPRCWSGACCLGCLGRGRPERGAGASEGGQEPLLPARMGFLGLSMLQRDKLRHRDTEGPTAVNRRYPVKPICLFQPKGLPAALLPNNLQDPKCHSSGTRQPLSRILLRHLLAVGSWSDTITTCSLSVPICKMRMNPCLARSL